MSDVLVAPARERSYRVPAVVQTAVITATHDYNSLQTFHAVRPVIDALISGTVSDSQLDIITSMSITAAAVLFGEDAVSWANRIHQSANEKMDTATLQKIGYFDKPESTYWGIESEPDSDILVRVVRSTGDDSSFAALETLTASGSWEPYEAVPGQTAVEMDRAITAALGQAILEGCAGLYLSYAEPVTFLRSPGFIEEQPLVAAIDPNRDYIYAIVDAADTTAVIDAIKIEPGPVVYRRDNSQWTRDESLLDSLLSASPPPLVELDEGVLEDVLAQIDSSKSNHLDVGPNGEVYEGSSIEDLGKPSAAKNRASGTQIHSPSKDTVGVTAAIARRYDESMQIVYKSHSSLVASARAEYAEDITVPISTITAAAAANREMQELQSRIQRINALAQRKRELESKEALLSIVAASNSVSAHARGQASAERLRQYWLHGKGALKIKWGVSGDWRRCYRHLRKYLGVRAKGYCQLMHKRATGMYTGDKGNR